MRIWEDILTLHKSQEVIKVKILRRIKGGMVVDLLGVEAFLPGSQIDIRPVRDFDVWVGQNMDVKVVKVNSPYENVVVSHKILLEEMLADQRIEIMKKLEKGLVLEGDVKAISEFGVFVDLGGIDGLVHITDLNWGRVTHPSEVVELDAKVRVVVLDFDKVKQRISLGMKQLTPHPWDQIGDKYAEETKVEGKVVSLTEYGAFIEVERGIEGLIHISEMSWTQHIKHPSQVVSAGQTVEAMVLSIDRDEKKLALGMKQLIPNPWEDLVKKYPVASTHHGTVRNLTIFGAFVELEEGVDGLVHISDLSWTKKIRHPGEFISKGADIDVVVLSIDPDQRRISLGHKQLIENPWDKFEETYKIGIETEARIERIIDKGVIMELPDNVDGFVPVSQLSFAPVRDVREYFEPGDILPLKVVEFDKETKKIILSVVECLRGKEQAIIDKYNKQHPVPNADRYSAGSELPEDIQVYQPGDKEIDEIIKQEFSYPEMPTDIIAATIEDSALEKKAGELGISIEDYKEQLDRERERKESNARKLNKEEIISETKVEEVPNIEKEVVSETEAEEIPNMEKEVVSETEVEEIPNMEKEVVSEEENNENENNENENSNSGNELF
jgi:small subunit ribosomal protein S1